MASPARAATFVYVGNAGTTEVRVLRLDGTTGDLTPVQAAPIPGVDKPGTSTPMAVSPDRRFLYVGTRGEPKVAAGFAIGGDGRLTHVASGPLADSMAYIATDRSGRFLLGASYPGNRITVNPIGPAGTVQAAHQVLENHPKAHSIQADPDNHHVLVPTLGNDLVNQFAFDAGAGRLTPSTPPAVHVKAAAGPRHFVFHPLGAVVYVLGETDAAVYAFAYDARTGRLTPKGPAVSALPPDFQGKPAAADLHVTPDGRFLYASERTSSTLAGFAIDTTTGALTPIGSVPTERQPRGFAIDSGGAFLLAVGQLSHGLTSYRIDSSTGRLDRLKSYSMGENPNWVEIVDLP